MRLTRLKIENFKRFRDLSVELSPFNCLVGANNSGKTTLLQALALLDFCVHHCLNRRNGRLELKRRTIPPEEFYVLPISNPMELWTDRRSMAENRQQVIRIEATFEEGRQVTASVKLDYNRFGIAVDGNDDSQEWLDALRGQRMAYLPVFSVFLAQEERRTAAVIDDELARGHVHSVIRNLILNLKEKERHNELLDVLKRSFPSLEDMHIAFDEVSDRYISVTYREAGRPKEFDVFSAGSGFQQFLYLFGFILLRQPTVILLDEPDVHLHGTLQKALLQELGRLVDEGKQVLLATHSRDLIQGVSPEDILSLEDEGARRLAVAFDVYDSLDRLGSVEATQLPVIQAYQRVLIVEDQADFDILAIFCSECLGASKWQEVERRLAICYSKGNPYKQNIARLREQLQQMIALRGRTLEAFVVSDWDYYPDRQHLREMLPSQHLRWHVWERAEIENYLLCADAIARLLCHGRGGFPLEEPAFRLRFDELLEQSKESANDHLVEGFDEYRRRRQEKWDSATMSRKAREYLKEHWASERLSLADAKEVVLPGIKRWLQDHNVSQFSNKALADAMVAEDLPEEMHRIADELAEFAGIIRP
jgi:predicted ATPase